ncbi:MAG: endonuclease domain-containing protein, partial [Pseudomonadota bacterium]
MLDAQIALDQFQQFEFGSHAFDFESGELRLRWCWNSSTTAQRFEESFQFPLAGKLGDERRRLLPAAFDLLHWVAGVSYWKLACEGEVAFTKRAPDVWQRLSLVEVYRQGLAELAWRNQLYRRYWPDFERGATAVPEPMTGQAGLSRRVLIALGGGKDSLVAVERVRAAGFEPLTVQVGSAALIAETARVAGTEHRMIRRSLSPKLAEFNRAGAINGHVPITAINSAALVIAALLWDCDTIVFANERSADTPTLVHDGHPINHQFAKSLEFEQRFGEWVNRYIASDLRVFSILRQETELGVCREFAALDQYHDVFSSCNRNFHLDGPRTRRWCG